VPIYYSGLIWSCRLQERYTICVFSMLLTSTDVGGRPLWMHKSPPVKSATAKTIIERVQRYLKHLTRITIKLPLEAVGNPPTTMTWNQSPRLCQNSVLQSMNGRWSGSPRLTGTTTSTSHCAKLGRKAGVQPIGSSGNVKPMRTWVAALSVRLDNWSMNCAIAEGPETNYVTHSCKFLIFLLLLYLR